MPYKLSPEEKETLETFDSLSNIYNEINGAHFMDTTFCNFLTLIEGKLILDVGCGTGRDSELFFYQGFKYVGIDMSKKMIAEACAGVNYPEAHFLCMNMAETGFKDESFDAFYSAASLMHIPRANLPEVMRELRRILKPGGVGFISTPYGDFEGMYEGKGKNPKTIGRKALCVCWEWPEFEKVLQDSGFDIIFAEEYSNMIHCFVQKTG